MTTAKDLLTYMSRECFTWNSAPMITNSGREHVIHEIIIRDDQLKEMLEMAGIKKTLPTQTNLEALERAAEEI